MDNYVYIVAGLPDLTANFGSSQFSYTDVRESIAELLSDADCQLVALLDEGFDEAALNADFYSRAAASRNRSYASISISTHGCATFRPSMWHAPLTCRPTSI